MAAEAQRPLGNSSPALGAQTSGSRLHVAVPAQLRQAEMFPEGSPPAAEPFEPAPIWLQRLSLGVLVIFCLYLGGILIYLPWWKQMWDDNSFLLDYPTLHHYILLGWVRGLVSGIGLLDLWIGISEIVHYREYRK